MKEQAKKEAESEAQVFIKRAEKLKKTLLASAKQKFAEAVDSVIQEILS
jgi:F0F1-type ATP synthase membrane subunit b/b'